METLVQLTGVAEPAAAPACVCRLHTVAVRQVALVSDESAQSLRMLAMMHYTNSQPFFTFAKNCF